MAQIVYLIFPESVQHTDIGAGFVVDCCVTVKGKVYQIEWRPFNSCTFVADTIWSSHIAKQSTLPHLRRLGLDGAVFAEHVRH